MSATYSETVDIASHFYRREIEMYSRPALGFWRELLQNSIDAGAKIVSIEIKGNHVSIVDDGCGMTEATLRNVFFRLGETSKTGADTIGGIGRARLIICFGQNSYEIRTLTNHVVGSGGRFSINRQPNFSGCAFSINTIWEESKLTQELVVLLSTCFFKNIHVFINGVKFTAFENKTSRKVYDLLGEDGSKFASAILVKTPTNEHNKGVALVRCRGLTMAFINYGSFNGTVIINIEPAAVRNVMTHNRDGFAWPYSSIVSGFLKTFSKNKSVMLLDRPAKNLSRVYRTNKSCWVGPSAATFVGATNIAGAPKPTFVSGDDNATPVDETVANDLRFTLVIRDMTNKESLKKKISAFSPDKLSAPKRKLLDAWTNAVLEQIEILFKLRPTLPGFNLSLGFVFSETVEGLCQGQDNSYIILINPLVSNLSMAARKLGLVSEELLTKEIGNDCYRGTNANDQAYIKILAMHEVCHIAYMDHDEGYANLLTSMMYENLKVKGA